MEFSHAITLVNARLGDIDRGRAAELNGKFGNQWLENLLDFFALLEVGIPFLLFVERRRLAKSGKRNLAAPIFDQISPALYGSKSGLIDRFVQSTDDSLLSPQC